jgi:hypothetical protein
MIYTKYVVNNKAVNLSQYDRSVLEYFWFILQHNFVNRSQRENVNITFTQAAGARVDREDDKQPRREGIQQELESTFSLSSQRAAFVQNVLVLVIFR